MASDRCAVEQDAILKQNDWVFVDHIANIEHNGGPYVLAHEQHGTQLGRQSLQALNTGNKAHLSQNLPNHYDAFEGLKGDPSKKRLVDVGGLPAVEVRRH